MLDYRLEMDLFPQDNLTVILRGAGTAVGMLVCSQPTRLRLKPFVIRLLTVAAFSLRDVNGRSLGGQLALLRCCLRMILLSGSLEQK